MFNVGSVQGYLKLNTAAWNTSMGRATASVQRLSRTFTRMSAMAVGSLFLIEREFGKFDKAIRHATSVSETSVEQFEQMSEMALDASVKWNKAATETAQAFYFLGSAGLTVTEQMQAFNDTIMLSRAMGSELGQTVEGIVDIVRAFGLEFADIANIADQVTKTIISSNQQFRTLAQALKYASSTARLTNNTLAETTAMLGVMANAGIKGSMAGTVLRRAMTNLMSPTGAMAALIYDLGVQIYDSTGKMNPFINIMGQISDQLDGASDAYKNMVFEVLFGRRAIAGQIVLFNMGSKALRKYADEIENAGGITERVAGKQMKAFLEILGQLWQEIRRLAITAGDTLAPAFEKIADRVREQLTVVRAYIKANSDAVAETLRWVAVVGTAALVFPPLLLILTSLTKQFIQLAVAMGSTALKGLAIGWKLAGPYAVILTTIYMIRAMLKKEGLWIDMEKAFLTTWDRVIEGTKGRFKTLQWIWYKGIMRLNELAKARKAATPEAIQRALEPWSEARQASEFARFSKAYDNFAEQLPGALGGKAADAAEVVIGHLSSVWETIGEQWKEDMGKLATGMEDAFETLGNALPDKVTAPLQAALDKLMMVVGTIQDMYGLFMGVPAKPGIDVQGLQGAGVAKAMAKLGEETKKTKEEVGYLHNEWNKAIESMFTDMAKATTWRRELHNMLGYIETEWADTFEDLMRKGGNLGDFMQGLWQGIINNFRRMVAEIAAADLLHAVFGGDTKRQFGTPSIMGGIRSLLDPAWRPPKAGVVDTGYTDPRAGDFTKIMGKRAIAPEGGTVINITNNGQPVTMRETGRQFDGKQWVVNVVMEEIQTNPALAQALRGEV